VSTVCDLGEAQALFEKRLVVLENVRCVGVVLQPMRTVRTIATHYRIVVQGPTNAVQVVHGGVQK